MKKNICIAIIINSLFLISCISVKRIGDINMISTRNIDQTLKYKVISTYSGGSMKELKKTRATSMQDAVDLTVKKVAGGEFLMNAKIYLVNGKYIAVEGDVWGASTNEDIAYRGFKVGDKVIWKKSGDYHTGVISALKDDKSCLVKDDNGGEISEKTYDDITKTSETVIKTSETVTNDNSNVSTYDFKVGDKVACDNGYGKEIEGAIIKIVGNEASVQYTKKNGTILTIKKDLIDLKKVVE